MATTTRMSKPGTLKAPTTFSACRMKSLPRRIPTSQISEYSETSVSANDEVDQMGAEPDIMEFRRTDGAASFEPRV